MCIDTSLLYVRLLVAGEDLLLCFCPWIDAPGVTMKRKNSGKGDWLICVKPLCTGDLFGGVLYHAGVALV